jgi:hypothetical protein
MDGGKNGDVVLGVTRRNRKADQDFATRGLWAMAERETTRQVKSCN